MRHAPLVILLVAIHIGALQAQLVRGQVVDSITGVSLARSMVILTSADGTEADRTTTDNRGFFLLRAPSHGSYYLIAVHEGYRHLIFPPFDLEAERMRSFVLLLTSLDAVPGTRSQQSEELAIKLCPTNTDGGRRVIVGTVSDAVTGETASGAQVHFSAPTAPGPETDSVPPRWSGQTTVLTGDDGTYALCDVPVMSRISVHAMEGDRRSSFDVVMFGATGVFHGGTFHSLTRPVWQQDLVLFPTDEQMARVTGFVKDTVGNAIPGAVVQIVGAPYEVRTNASGEFEFSNLTQGAIRVQAKQVGYSPAEYDLDLLPGETVQVPEEMLALGPSSIRLSDINVIGDALRNNRRLDGFFERRATLPQGRFATRDDWRPWISSVPSEIITRLRGYRGAEMQCEGDDPTPRYFLDGMYLGSARTFVLDDIPEDWLDAIEVYPAAADAPPRYRRDECASIVLMWTRAR
jgi:hypothetical protein